MENLDKEKIWVTGHAGMVGTALLGKLQGRDILVADSKDLDLREESAVIDFAKEHRPTIVFNLAARVGGIQANATRPVEFLLDNLKIQNNVLQAAASVNVKKFVFLGSACTYPKFARQPIHEDELMSGAMEPTNVWYATAKLAGIKLAQAMRLENRLNTVIAMPANSYGPFDNFSGEDSHVIPALIKKFHAAKHQGAEAVEIWGTGSPLREFLYVDDLADALIFLCKRYNCPEIINVGSGQEVAIGDLAKSIADVVGYEGQLVFDKSKPDGAPRKLLNSERLRDQGWSAGVGLPLGLEKTYQWAVRAGIL